MSFDFGKFVAKDSVRLPLQYTWEMEDYRVATDMFHLVYEKLDNSLEEGFARVFDKKNNLIYSGKSSADQFGIFPKFSNAIVIKPTRTAKIDFKQIAKSIEDLKAVVKENKAKLKQYPKHTYVMSDDHRDAYKKSQWLDRASFVIDGVVFNYETISLMLYVKKMWQIDTLMIESPYKGCMMQSEDETKKAFFMPVTIYGTRSNNEVDDLDESQKKMLKQRGYFVDIDFL